MKVSFITPEVHLYESCGNFGMKIVMPDWIIDSLHRPILDIMGECRDTLTKSGRYPSPMNYYLERCGMEFYVKKKGDEVFFVPDKENRRQFGSLSYSASLLIEQAKSMVSFNLDFRFLYDIGDCHDDDLLPSVEANKCMCLTVYPDNKQNEEKLEEIICLLRDTTGWKPDLSGGFYGNTPLSKAINKVFNH